MRKQIEERLKTLRTEYEKGQNQLRQLELQSTSLRETLLRMTGAIMILEETLALTGNTADPSPLAELNINKKGSPSEREVEV